MKNKQLLYLFLCNFVIWFIGLGLLPILPLYAMQFGATPTVAGIYLAFTYLSITMGTMLTGWLSGRLGPQGLFVGAGVVGIPVLVLLGQTTELWQIVILTAIVWFCAGIGLALVSVFTGLFTDDKSRGKSFGLTWLAFPSAALTGGAAVGQLVAWQGYPLLFAVLGVVWAGWPLAGCLMFKDRPVSIPGPSVAVTDKRSRPPAYATFGRAFYVVLLVVFLSSVTVYTGRLGMSLLMDLLSFSPGAVASTSSVGGLVTIPVTFLIGMLSDRLERKFFLIGGYLLAAGGALMLSLSTQLWHFWLASGLLFVGMSANGSVAPAFITDLLPPPALSRGLPWLNAMTRIGGIVGFAGAGYLMDSLGATGFSILAATLPVVAAALLMLPQGERRVLPQARPSGAGIA